MLNIKYMVLDPALLHSYSTTDTNTSTGMIGVTLNMSECHGGVLRTIGEFHIVWRAVTLELKPDEFNPYFTCTAYV